MLYLLGLAYDNDGRLISLKRGVNGVDVQGEMKGDIHLSFLYDKKYVAYVAEKKHKRYFPIKENAGGYIVVKNVQSENICIEYRDMWSCMAVLCEILATVFLAVNVVFIEFNVKV